MIKYTDTTVFNVESQTIVNTVNCVGVMGAGLALEFKLRYPDMYEDYLNRCKQKQVRVDHPYLYRGYESPWIMNFATKNHWKYPSKLEWIEQGLTYFVDNYERAKIESIAFPKLGCDKGGLNWHDVREVMEKYLSDVDIDVYICLDRESHASGTEGLMVEMLNKKNNQFWISKLKIRSNIVDKINSALPIQRFRQLQKIPGVGKKTYEDIFKLLYSKSQSEMAKNLHSDKQLTGGDSEREPTQLQLLF
ncbi:macro domain-containing protein [Lyngbya sp. CCY1209]|uniref:macro domain-containing protein n=1 Tax=Lyngbya sp. CCY1209 TaxID=2886103 RepID=UPI002D2060BD|nr:macro domain-containing protein [Lyngbya sp. CCY1209]MEB3887246.1 macro domain-containing protein [Lyngbya sp. CCY1209]